MTGAGEVAVRGGLVGVGAVTREIPERLMRQWIGIGGRLAALFLAGSIGAAGAGEVPAGAIGPLVIVGGHEEKAGGAAILREFARLAGGDRARLLVVMYPSKGPREVRQTYREAFERLEVEGVDFLQIDGDDRLDRPDALEALGRATGVFFTGGKQELMAGRLRGTRFQAELERRCAAGMVVGGTSAGAAMMPATMLVDGESEECPRVGSAEMVRGLGLIRGVVIDSHFAQRGRIGRLLAAVAEDPERLGLGLGEDTAMIVRGAEFEVLGKGVVTVIDAAHLAHTNADRAKEGAAIALMGLTVHTLPAGYRFNLRTRTPLPPGDGQARR